MRPDPHGHGLLGAIHPGSSASICHSSGPTLKTKRTSSARNPGVKLVLGHLHKPEGFNRSLQGVVFLRGSVPYGPQERLCQLVVHPPLVLQALLLPAMARLSPESASTSIKPPTMNPTPNASSVPCHQPVTTAPDRYKQTTPTTIKANPATHTRRPRTRVSCKVNRPEFRAYFLTWEGWHVHAGQVRPGHGLELLYGGRPSKPERGNGLGKRAGSFSFWAVKSCSGSSVAEEIIRQWTSVVTDAGGLLELRVSSALDRRHPRGLSSRLDPGRAHRNRRRSIRTPQFTKPKPNHANRPAPASGDVPHQPIAPFRLTWSAPVVRTLTGHGLRTST